MLIAAKVVVFCSPEAHMQGICYRIFSMYPKNAYIFFFFVMSFVLAAYCFCRAGFRLGKALLSRCFGFHIKFNYCNK